jgi:hypothetical protein
MGKPISNQWTDSERLFLCVAIAERIRDGQVSFTLGAQTIVELGVWNAKDLENNRRVILKDAGLGGDDEKQGQQRQKTPA